ncbi:integrase catalytic domain-containing protein [Trichonephila clavipes]|uniref:Integrase catalytic domain-containing protein n=1 Tax=Trichonephila clavipes TaxID=2585209 RepID=A0A8X7B8F0_TRICX|nr:integrase catalytic domain-containing protein [Trichonephila clavipes]
MSRGRFELREWEYSGECRTVVFLRIKKDDRTEVSFLTSKARVSSLRGAMIPRMELLATVIGTRLTNSVIKALQWENIKRYYWSDSTTVLAWIQRDDNRSVFVRNRVNEIRKQSDPTSWRHGPGEMNPADLPSPKGKRYGELVASEFQEAEEKLKSLIQNEGFSSDIDDRLKALQAFRDEKGILLLKTKITNRKDNDTFLKPAILPPNHEVIKILIVYAHEKNCHAGVQILLNILRETYWILHGRTVKRVLISCITCKRFSSRNLKMIVPPLPEDRVKNAEVFQITGIDMAGPLFLKENKKSWVLIFTCAVYRAVHFELVTATTTTTEAFLMAFRRFVSRRGRCSTVYCDNATNFGEAANAQRPLDWKQVERQGAINAIEWKFNPPTAAW